MTTIAEMEARKLEKRRELKDRYQWDGTGLTMRQECQFCTCKKELIHIGNITICRQCARELLKRAEVSGG